MWKPSPAFFAILWVGCASLPEPPRVVTDIVGQGSCGRLYVERCALLQTRFGQRLRDCAVELRMVGFRGPVAQCFSKEQLAAMNQPAVPPQPPSAGTLGVISFPVGAAIDLDGKAVGRSPLVLHQVAPGNHTIHALWSDGVSSTTEQEVAAGRVVTARVFRP